MATNKYLDYEGLQEVASKVNKKQDVIQVSVMPSNPIDGKIVQWVGASTADYTNGLFYRYDSEEDKWVQVSSSINPNERDFVYDNSTGDLELKKPIFIGTQDEWDALTTDEKKEYSIVHFTDDEVEGSDPTLNLDPDERDFIYDSVTGNLELKEPIFVGTQAEWDALSAAVKKTYGVVNITDDDSGTNLDYYSTSEVKTNKVWIDGKPIYRKVVIQDLSSAFTGLIQINLDIQNIDTPIRIVWGRAEVVGANSTITIPAQYDDTTFAHLGVFDPSYVQLYAGSTNWTGLNRIMLCLEYTKTTD